jgi:ABC transporter
LPHTFPLSAPPECNAPCFPACSWQHQQRNSAGACRTFPYSMLQQRQFTYHQRCRQCTRVTGRVAAKRLPGVPRPRPTAVPASSSQGTPAEQMNQITTDLLQMFYSQLAQQQQATTTGATLAVQHLTYHPPGAEQPLLNDVSFTLPANTMGLLIGRSGSGKTTLLQVCCGLWPPVLPVRLVPCGVRLMTCAQVLAGFAQQTSGDIILVQSAAAVQAAATSGTAAAGSCAALCVLACPRQRQYATCIPCSWWWSMLPVLAPLLEIQPPTSYQVTARVTNYCFARCSSAPCVP